jgi:enoyl-CoA hydratase/carnithine racemase
MATRPAERHPISVARIGDSNGKQMPDILITDDGAIRTIRMNRPDKKNALTLAMYEAMGAAITEANTLPAIRCLLLTGGDAFCAGNDINDFVTASQGGALAEPVVGFLDALVKNEKPIVAAVAGPAVGIGTTMLLHCDHMVAAADAVLSTPFVALGLLPEAASTLILPRLLGHPRAFELLVMGHPLTAEAACEAGLVNKVVAPAALEEEALKAAREIAALPPDAVKTARRLMRSSIHGLSARIDEEVALFKERLQSDEAKAAFAAFLNRKR